MIVADTNLLAYLLLPGDFTDQAERVRAWDPDWHVPHLWASEFRNVLVVSVRREQLSADEAREVFSDAFDLVRGKEHQVEHFTVLERALDIGSSAYDAEYVTLAEELGCPLVTADRRLAKSAPATAHLLSEIANSI